MRKFLACCALAFTVGYVQAQTTSGSMMLGGTLSYSSQKIDAGIIDGEYTYKNFSFRPQFGYFVADNLVIGLAVDLNNQKTTYPFGIDGNDNEENYSEVSVAPFVRYYLFSSNEKFAFYAEASLGHGFTETDPQEGDKYNGNVFRARLSPGFSYFFSKKWALDLELSGISYRKANPNNDSDADHDASSDFSFGVSSFNPALGFRYFMGK